MKVFPIALAAHYEQRTTTLVACLKVTRKDGTILGLTECDRKFDFDGVTYYPGFSPSDFSTSAGLNVDNQEVQILPGEVVLTQAELAAGLWDNAAFEVFHVNFRSLADGRTPPRRGTTGEAQLNEGMWIIEFRGLKQAFQQSLGEVTSKTCRHRLGSTSIATGGLCMVDLEPFTFTLTVTAVTNKQTFTASAATQDAEYFKDGQVEFLTGDNEKFSQKVKAFEAGEFTTSIPMPFTVQVGNTFEAIRGCQKRLSDCLDFDNVLNFGGEPHLPGPDGLTALP